MRTIKVFCFLVFSLLCITCNSIANNLEEVYRSESLLVYRISKHVYEHISYLDTESFGKVGCNGMIVASNNEAIVFDTTTTDESSAELINWIEKTLKCKITAVVPTHYHEDNLGGLNEFHKREIPSYAYYRTIEIAKEKGEPLAQNKFNDFLELKVGNEKVYAEFLGGGHTCDNTIGYFPLENIMFGGCLIKAEGSGKGNLEEANEKDWPETVCNVKVKYPDTRVVIPGHGALGGAELFDYTINLFKTGR